MTDSDHIIPLTIDYALGLLPAGERRRVDTHVRQCAACRAALQRELEIEPLARGAIFQATRPVPERLAAVRAAVARPVSRPRALPLYRRLVPVTVVTIILALGLLAGRDYTAFTPPVFAGGTPTLAVTNTQTPTATLASSATAGPAQSPQLAPPRSAVGVPQPAATSAAPRPAGATPIIVTAAP